MKFKLEQLNKAQLESLKKLALACKNKDKYAIPFYSSILIKPRPVPSTILYYDQQKLIGFISAYFFHQDACEIALMVDPDFRQQGIAKQLLTEILDIIRGYQIFWLIFSSPQELNTRWFSQNGFNYHHTEYQLQKSLTSHLPMNTDLNIRLALKNDIPALCEISEQCFASDATVMEERFHYLLDQQEYTLFVLQKDDQIIGKVHLMQENNHVNLSDLAILPSFQRLGFGKQLLSYCINYSIAKKLSFITLDVEATNEQALKMYINIGFQIINACDYWKIAIDKFKVPLDLQN